MSVSHILGGKGSNVVTMPPTSSVQAIAETLAKYRIGAVVVTDSSGHPLGIASERDVVAALARSGGAALGQPVTEIMTAKVKTCKLTDSETDLMRMMTDNRIRHLPVVEKNHLAGIVSIGDVVKHRIAMIERETDDMRSYIATAG